MTAYADKPTACRAKLMLCECSDSQYASEPRCVARFGCTTVGWHARLGPETRRKATEMFARLAFIWKVVQSGVEHGLGEGRTEMGKKASRLSGVTFAVAYPS